MISSTRKTLSILTLAGAMAAGTAAFAASASIDVNDQAVKNKSVTIKSLNIPQNGWAVIHATDKDGNPIAPSSIGHTMVKKGMDQNVKIKLTKSVKKGDKLMAMLHMDTGKKGKYEFGKGSTDVDQPVTADGKAVTKFFNVQ